MADPYYAKGPEDLLSRETLLSVSGLELLQGIVTGTYPAPPMWQTANILPILAEDGRVSLEACPHFVHVNPVGVVHGGWHGTVLDSALGCVAMTKTPRGSTYTTLEYKVNITRALSPGTEVICTATALHAGKSTVVASAETRGKTDGKLYSSGTTTCIILGMG